MGSETSATSAAVAVATISVVARSNVDFIFVICKSEKICRYFHSTDSSDQVITNHSKMSTFSLVTNVFESILPWVRNVSMVIMDIYRHHF